MKHFVHHIYENPRSFGEHFGICNCGLVWPCKTKLKEDELKAMADLRAIEELRSYHLFCDELERAEKKHPDWPKDPVDQTAIMMEEAGESIQAALDWKYEQGDPQLLIDEVVQTGAMCLRILKGLDKNWKPFDHQFRDNMIIDILKDVMRGLASHGEVQRVSAVQQVIHEMGG